MSPTAPLCTQVLASDAVNLVVSNRIPTLLPHAKVVVHCATDLLRATPG